MAKEHDDWLAGLGAAADLLPKGETKGKFNHKFAAVRKVPDGLGLAGGYEDYLAQEYLNLQCGPVPLLLSAKLKYGVEGEASAKGLQKGERQVTLSVAGYVAGTVAFGPGKHAEAFTVHAYAALTLGARAQIECTHTEGKGWEIAPVTLRVYAKGTVGATVHCHAFGGDLEVTAEAKLADWELFVVELRQWQQGRPMQVTCREGKDITRLREAFRDPGQKLEDAARWMAESETAKKIADGTGKVLDVVKDNTGVDVAGALEDGVARAMGERTRAEQDAALKREIEAQNALTAEFHAAMKRLGIASGQPLARWRTQDEWNQLVDALSSDCNQISNGKPPQRRWQALGERLAAECAVRRQAKAQHEALVQAAMTAAQAMKAVETAFALADRSRNFLSQSVPADKNDIVHKAFNKGDQLFRAGLGQRADAAGMQGEDCVAMAQRAIASFTQARQFMLAGQATMKQRKEKEKVAA